MSDSTESVYVIHGDGAFAVKVHDLINLFHFDHCFASHYEPAEYFRKRNVSYARPTAQVHVGSYRWRVNARLARRRLICLERAGDSIRLNMWSPPEKISGSLPIVVYLVTATGWDTRYLNSAWYPDTWYYQLQTRIIDSVVGKDHYTFVVKLFPGDERLSKPIVEHVRDLPARNIHTSRAPFSQWLPWADRVIVDFPSTGLYEAAVAGVPFHLLLYEKIKVRTTALERLRPWTTVFSKPEEAVEAVDRFLHASVKREAIIHHEENEILSTLESLVAKKPV